MLQLTCLSEMAESSLLVGDAQEMAACWRTHCARSPGGSCLLQSMADWLAAAIGGRARRLAAAARASRSDRQEGPPAGRNDRREGPLAGRLAAAIGGRARRLAVAAICGRITACLRAWITEGGRRVQILNCSLACVWIMGGRAGWHMRMYSWMVFYFENEGYNGLFVGFLNLSETGRNDL